MKTKWIILVVCVALFITICDAKKKKSNKNEVNGDGKSIEESVKSNEANIQREKPSKRKYTNDQKAKDKKTNKKTIEDNTEKTPRSQAVAHNIEEVSESTVVQKDESAPLKEEKSTSTSLETKPVKETKTSKSKSTKKPSEQSKKEKTTIENDQVEEPRETSEKTEL